MAFHNTPFKATVVNKRLYLLTRIEGSGEYTFQNGTVYKGQFKDGHFHGQGSLFFVNGSKLDADWNLVNQERFTFADGLSYVKSTKENELDNPDWKYCIENDRRFYTEIVHGFRPGRPQLTNDDVPDEGCVPKNEVSV